MKQYQDLIRNIIENGEYKDNRTGIGTYSIFGTQMRFKMADGFPLVTTKFTPFKAIAHELLWFISGNTNIKYLQDNGVHIWDEWADEFGNLGPVYGAQWRKWQHSKVEFFGDIACGLSNDPADDGYEYKGTVTTDGYSDWGLYMKNIDQLQNVIDKLKTNPNDRRLIVNAWNPALLPDDSKSFAENIANDKQALPPCHSFFQFYHINGKLSLQIYQRSVDSFLGLPFNIASYALLLHMVAQVTGLEPYELVWTGGDTHIYENHLEQCKLLLSREPFALPELVLTPKDYIEQYEIDDIYLRDYLHHPTLKGKVAV